MPCDPGETAVTCNASRSGHLAHCGGRQVTAAEDGCDLHPKLPIWAVPSGCAAQLAPKASDRIHAATSILPAEILSQKVSFLAAFATISFELIVEFGQVQLSKVLQKR